MFQLNVLDKNRQFPRWCNAWVCCPSVVFITCIKSDVPAVLRMFDRRWPLSRRCAVECRVRNKSPLWKLNIIVCHYVTFQKWEVTAEVVQLKPLPWYQFAGSSNSTGSSPAQTGRESKTGGWTVEQCINPGWYKANLLFSKAAYLWWRSFSTWALILYNSIICIA